MIELIPASVFSWSYRIKQDGTDIGRLSLSRIKSAGSLAVQGRQFELNRESLFGSIDLVEAGRVVARAERKGLIRAKYLITAQDRSLLVVGTGFMPRAAQVVHGDVVIATIRRPSLWRRIVTVEAIHPAPLPLLVFCTAIIILYWRKVSRSS